jgi:hypothetical protein
MGVIDPYTLSEAERGMELAKEGYSIEEFSPGVAGLIRPEIPNYGDFGESSGPDTAGTRGVFMIMHDAIESIQTRRRAYVGKDRRGVRKYSPIWREDLAWVRSSASHGPAWESVEGEERPRLTRGYSFLFCCEMMNLDPAAVRKRIDWTLRRPRMIAPGGLPRFHRRAEGDRFASRRNTGIGAVSRKLKAAPGGRSDFLIRG